MRALAFVFPFKAAYFVFLTGFFLATAFFIFLVEVCGVTIFDLRKIDFQNVERY
jgi:hypothetical protein